jgi:hypothetical protein
MTYEAGKIERAMRMAAFAFNKMCRPLARLGWSAGDHHIDRICQEILHGVPGRDPALRLQCAVLFAEVLDKGER